MKLWILVIIKTQKESPILAEYSWVTWIMNINVQMHPNQTFRQYGILFGYQYTQFCLLSFYVCMFYIFTIIFYKKFIQHANNSRYKKLGVFH